jgi:hypothetical protein
MMGPYAEFLVDFERRHADYVHRNSPRNSLAAVIVESRPHYFLPKVIRNVMYFLGPEWNLYVLTARPTIEFVHRSLPGWLMPVAPLPEKLLSGSWPRGSNQVHLPRPVYNHLLTRAEFWQSFHEDKLLTFQTDSLLTRRNIADFLQWDYIGAPCTSFDENYFANGGLALRTRRMMLDCLKLASPVENEPEDTFYTDRVRQLRGAIPDVYTAARFSVETAYVGHPLGVHGTDKYLHPLEIAERIVRAVEY